MSLHQIAFLGVFSGFSDVLVAIGPVIVGSITVIASLLLGYWTIKSNEENKNKEIRANIVSKERAFWLKEHKSLLAEYLNLINSLKRSSNFRVSIAKLPNTYTNPQEEYDNTFKAYAENQEKLFLAKELLILNLPSNEDNDEFVSNIEKVYYGIEEFANQNMKFENSPDVLTSEDIQKSAH
ncbi:hypothetical protein LAX76_11885 [Listeria monocytogenes]|uniref:hypothetical protein n=1 Tax=Listeria monocytogenes TaxID=1639 RepID=UPI001E58D0CE|nr:hypothetical protein [Listeria monocytogenes]MCD2219560.1 hypothetical protein [Listeria monocytogenes]